MSEADEHDGLNCPQCQAIFAQGQAIGNLAEALEKMLADGFFERLGAKVAEERERHFMEAWLGEKK